MNRGAADERARPGPRSPRRRRGFTLAEFTVAFTVFALFTTSLVATMGLCMRYYRSTRDRVLAAQNARLALSVICSEFRQAVRIPVNSTAILDPSTNNGSGSQIIFTEITSTYNPLNTYDQSGYQKVRYYVSGTSIMREVTTLNSSGAATSISSNVIVSASSTGSLALGFIRLAENSSSIQVTSREGGITYVLRCNQVAALPL